MLKLFLDANVLFSAVNSPTGGSAYIFELAKRLKIKLFTSRLVLKEAERNLREKTSEEIVLKFYDLLGEIPLCFTDVNRAKTKRQYASLVGEKDAPILAAAIASRAEFLITLDKKHFLRPKVLQTKLPVKILTPGQFIEKYL